MVKFVLTSLIAMCNADDDASLLQANDRETATMDTGVQDATLVGSLKEAHNLAHQIVSGEWPTIPPGHICLPVSAFSAPSASGSDSGSDSGPDLQPPSCDSYSCRSGSPASGFTVSADGEAWDGECMFDEYYPWSSRRDIKIRENLTDISCELRGLTIFSASDAFHSPISMITIEKTNPSPVYVYFGAQNYSDGRHSNFYQGESVESVLSEDSEWEVTEDFPTSYSASGTPSRMTPFFRRLMTETKLDIEIPLTVGEKTARHWRGLVGIGA